MVWLEQNFGFKILIAMCGFDGELLQTGGGRFAVLPRMEVTVAAVIHLHATAEVAGTTVKTRGPAMMIG